ncbi:NACHT, LRR and PYD domains-containing protein 5-like [Discoglossus pictus]
MDPLNIFRRSLGFICVTILLAPACDCITVNGSIGQAVLLPCNVIYKDVFDYQELVVNWQRSENDTVVHSFYYNASQSEYQDKGYQGRTQIFYELLPTGNASLLLMNLSKSDTGNYTCYVIIKEATGHTTKHVELIVNEKQSDRHHRVHSMLVLVIILVNVVFIIIIIRIKQRKISIYKQNNLKYKDWVKTYRKNIIGKYPSQKDHLFPRELRIVCGQKLCTTLKKEIEYFGDLNIIKSEDLFKPNKKNIISERMLLVGDSGMGKSCLCKWFLKRWAQGEHLIYKCMLYLSFKKCPEQQLSVRDLLEKCKAPIDVLKGGNHEVLLILDDIDDLYCDKDENLHLSNDIDTPFDLNTFVTKIINKKLLPETDVLISCNFDSFSKLHSNCQFAFIIQDFSDNETQSYCDTITSNSQKSQIILKTIKENDLSDFTKLPVFNTIICNFLNSSNNQNKLSTPNEVLIDVLQTCLKEMNENELNEDELKQMAKVSYENLAQRKRYKMGKCEDALMSYWRNALSTNDKCYKCSKYQCDILRDILAALHCVWEIHSGQDLNQCLNFWAFGSISHDNKYNKLIQPIVDEHKARFNNFVKFFMRLLIYPDYNSLINNQPAMIGSIKEELVGWFTAQITQEPSNTDLLKVINCLFELYDEQVRNKVSPDFKNIILRNTPLNARDIRALKYCLKMSCLDKIDLRLCGLRDQGVAQLSSIIRSTKYVLISSNNLTTQSGDLLSDILKDPRCATEKLSLGTNNLGPTGAQGLWKALEHNRSLRYLYLYDNDIGDGGTKGMTESLMMNQTLKELQLCGNSFGKDGYKNIKLLQSFKKDLKIVLRITENEELFTYGEQKVRGLSQTWKNYDEVWLRKMLKTVKKDLITKDCDRDMHVAQHRIDRLNKEINNILSEIPHRIDWKSKFNICLNI